MRAPSMYGLLLLLGTFISCSTVQAAWEIRKIDTHTAGDSTRLEGELIAYEKEGDIYLHRISSGTGTRVTHDAYGADDTIIDLEEETLWYWAHDRYTTIYDLHRYSVESGRDEWMFSFDAAIAGDQGTAEADRLVIWKDHEWYLVEGYSLERLTFSGEDLVKQQAALTGDYLVWRAVAEAPGVYVTYLPTRETNCLFHDDLPPGSLCVSGMDVAWVSSPNQPGGVYTVLHHRLDTLEIRAVGTSEEETWGQVTIAPPYLLWIKKAGPSWLLMRTHLEDDTEESVYESALPMLFLHVSGNDILLVTKNCQGAYESCWELNVFNQENGSFTQLTHFGADNHIFSPVIDGEHLAFTRFDTNLFPNHEVYAGFKTSHPTCGTLSRTGGREAAFNLALLLIPLVITPPLCRRLL